MSIRATLPEADLCRLSIATPANVLELALPTAVPLADFLPAVLSFAGPELADAGLAHDGWVLQRVGGAPLPAARTLAELQILDGETLYLRPRRATAPTAVFDDVVDGLATAVREREDRLRESAGRWAGPVLGVVALGAGAAGVAAGPGPIGQRAAVAGALAVLVLIGAAVAGRLMAARPTATALGVAAVGWAALGGWLAADTFAHTMTHPESAAALWAGAAALLASAAAAAAVGGAPGGIGDLPSTPRRAANGTAVLDEPDLGTSGLEPFATTAIVAVGTVVAGALGVGFHRALSQTTMISAVIGLGFVLAVPRLAFRLAGQRLPALPATAERIQVDLPPRGQADLWTTSARVERIMAALLLGSGLLAVGGATPAAGHGVLGAIAAADLGIAFLLRARVFARTTLRLLLQSIGMLALAGGAWRAAAVAHTHAVGVTAGIAVGTLVIGMIAASIGPKPQSDDPPYAARAADVAEYFVLTALVPLALGVIGVFGWARGLAG
ncbi:secretion protein snm4 [Catenulispora acidiphila DSM 44928]|uniref:Secretion protein snm4 n=1 Tax=Catenulispora acidiphila (strain DSM 44928 / JCM 14897 / NBRC 102108 / NRRL B-24433 / ID139908) TaxID=479433 RepID=C7PYH6_CATAD|nr:type VII secretion integral membrane protein EccD [Catenulispora acidiphila]ACU77298.1 secretion protein snm4 [Catenulispora acidiphila DSM 44928]